MRFLTALRLGLRRARRRPGLIVIAWLAALVPALLLGSFVYSDVSSAMDDSLFARQALAGNRAGVWTDFSSSPASDLTPLREGLGLRLLLVVVFQALVSAGIVESLLGAAPLPTRPFLLGIGRHGWRFLRTLIWFGVTVLVLGALAALYFRGVYRFSQQAADGSLHLWGLIGGLIWVPLVFAFLDLGYDLARIASAAHYDGRTLKGYLLALGHAFRHPLLLLPLWLSFALAGLAAHVGYLALRAKWSPASLGAVLGLLGIGQLFLLFHACLRVGLWGSLVAYYQGIGEPRWCIKGSRPRPAPPPPAPPPEPDTEPVIRARPASSAGAPEPGPERSSGPGSSAGD